MPGFIIYRADVKRERIYYEKKLLAFRNVYVDIGVYAAIM